MKRLLLAWLALLAVPLLASPAAFAGAAGTICSYDDGAPLTDMDFFEFSRNCGGTRKISAPNLATYVLSEGSLTIPDGDYGDIVVGSAGADWQIDAGVILNADINASASIALSKLAAVTASRALVSDASGFVSASGVTATELGYLSGVTSGLQTQLDAKAALNSPVFTDDFDLATAGVRFSGADGVLTLLGLGNGNDENLILDFDNGTTNSVGVASGTGVTSIIFTGISLTADVTGDVTGNADTATAFAADPADCSAGEATRGINAGGVAQNCFDVWTEAENTAAAYLAAGSSPSITGTWDFGGGALEIPNSNTLPATCAVGRIYMDTDATSGQRLYLCESANTWVLQGDGNTGGGGGVSDGDKGDITVSGTGATWTIDNDAVTDAKLRNSAALSVIGRSANTTGDPADIAASATGQVLRYSGTTIAFGAVDLADTDAVTGLLPFANIASGSALSVLGRSANSSGVHASIAAGSDHQVLRRSGTSLGFGAVNLAQSAAVTGSLPVANGGTAATAKAGAQDNLGVRQEYCVAMSDQSTDLTTGTGKANLYLPAAATVEAVRAYVNTAPVGSTIIVDINEAGTTLMSTTKLSIDASEKTSGTAASAAALTDTSIAANAEITFDIDQVGSSTTGKGLVACIEVVF